MTMKKIITLIIAVLMAMPVFAQGAQYRKKLKEIKREGWELFGSSKTMKDALRDHHFYSAYETLLQKEIRGELRPSYTLVRRNADGTCQMMSFFVVNEAAATNARIKAMELAASESEAAQRIAGQIREYVQEGFQEQGDE